MVREKELQDVLIKMREELIKKPDWAVQYVLENEPANFVALRNELEDKFSEKLIIKTIEKLLKAQVIVRFKEHGHIKYGIVPAEDWLIKTQGKVTKEEK